MTTPTPRTDAAELEAFIGVTAFDGSDLEKAFNFARTLEREVEFLKSAECEAAWCDRWKVICAENESLRQKLAALAKDKERLEKLLAPGGKIGVAEVVSVKGRAVWYFTREAIDELI